MIYFQITSPYRAAFGITDLRQALIERAQTTLRHVVGARNVQSVVTEREAIAFEIAEIVGDVADKWGVAIEGILIKDIIFSAEVAASLSSAAQQKRIGESKGECRPACLPAQETNGALQSSPRAQKSTAPDSCDKPPSKPNLPYSMSLTTLTNVFAFLSILASPAAMQIRQLEARTFSYTLSIASQPPSNQFCHNLSATNGQAILQQSHLCADAAAERCHRPDG